MADISKALKGKFREENRYENFGACVNSLKIKGFRGMTCDLNFEFPVTAITGLNGAGKSTVGQLLLCGYKKLPESSNKRWYVKNFFPFSVVDPSPFDNDASVEYHYQTSVLGANQLLTVARATKEWGGYKRQPKKSSIYVGLAFYLPKVERGDLTIYGAKNITLGEVIPMGNGAKWASRILGNHYEDVFIQGVENNTSRTAELGMAERLNAVYSENHMGSGEGRVIHTIRLLETCPNQSLIVFEEPETSLHESAQYEFAKYLMDVSSRRGHQILFSSHSSSMISALPTEGRKMLSRDNDGVKVHDRLSSTHLRTALTEGHKGHLVVCVEDEFAKSLLIEIIRLKCPDLVRRVRVHSMGDARAVGNAVAVLRESGSNAIGVRDGDKPKDIEHNLHTLPGDCAPEKLVFLSDAGKKELKTTYDFDIVRHLTAYPEANHHAYAKEVEKKNGTFYQVIEVDCIRKFIQAQPGDWGQGLIDWIKDQA